MSENDRNPPTPFEGDTKEESIVTPAKAGVQKPAYLRCFLDSRRRGNDEFKPFPTISNWAWGISDTLFPILTLITLTLFTTAVHAGGERVWELAGYDEFSRGELQHTVLSEKGEILAGLASQQVDLESVGLVWSVAKADDGTIYLGTAYEGNIYRIDGNRANLIASTDNLVVTDMVIDADGALIAATIPTPSLFKIEHPDRIDPKSPVKAEAALTLAGEEMIWSLAIDEASQTLYVGTGPEGRIWAVGKDYVAELFLESGEKHILDILPFDGGIYAGTSPNALLLKVTAPGVSFAVADFEGTEVKSIAALEKDALAVGVNNFTYPRSVPSSSKKNGTAAKVASAVSAALTSGKSGTKTSSKDKGYVYRVSPDGSQEILLEKSGTHITTVAVSDNGTIWAAMGTNGKIFSVTKDRNIFEAADLAQREVMCLIADHTLSFAATGDAGAAYFFSSKDTIHAYLTPVLNADTVSTFGRASWIAKGNLKVTARTGNTITPDDNWTAWSPPIANGDIPQLKKARHAQFRFEWASKSAALLQFELFYRPDNRRAVITEFDPDTPFKDTSGMSKGDAGTSERTVTLRPDDDNPKQLSLSWRVDNPDKDDIRYRLYYKPLDKTLWIPIFKEDVRYTKTRYAFETETVPEGRYHFRLTAEDSIENPADAVLFDEEISVPVDIDNHPPQIPALKYSKDTNVMEGKAQDSYSPIGALDYAVDGGLWLPIAAKDGMLDETAEQFQFKVSPPLAKGGHVIAVRATDRQGNFTVREIHLEIKE